MSTAFDSTLETGPLRQHGTLQHFFESCLSLERDPDSLAKIKNLLHRLGKERKDSVVNSLHKKKMGKEMGLNIHIENYEVDSVIMDLVLDVNILTKKTWKTMGRTMLGWSPIQLQLANQDKVQPIGRVLNLAVWMLKV